ncbi:MAG: T9SS type A sorting domain-containing protein [Bacteroidota bacterium]
MKKFILASVCLIILIRVNHSQTIYDSRFGASVTQWADASEGWDNFVFLGVHYIRMPIDVLKGAMVDNFFLQQYDTLVARAQQHGLIVYAIINPRKNTGQFASTAEVAAAVNAIVDRYDGDGTGDMPGLQYPIKNWELCNEVTYDAFANNPGSPGYPLWSGFTKAEYLSYMDTARSIITNTCSDCNLFNGAQLLPPSEMFPSVCDLTAPEPDGNGPDIIDKISYHDYTQYFEINQASTDFTDCGIGTKPIWIVEAGMQNEYIQDSSLTQEENAKRTVKSFAYVFIKGVEKLIFTTMRAGLSDQESIQWESLLDPATGAKKKVFWAYKKMIEKIDYFADADTIYPHNDSSIFAIKFTVDGKPVYMLWANTDQTVNISLSSTDVPGVTVTNSVPDDTLGNFSWQHFNATNGVATLNISPEAVYVEEDVLVNVNEISNSEYIKIYPNPAEDIIFLEILQKAEVEILNIQGKVMKTYAVDKNKTVVDVSAFPYGVYFMKIKTDSGFFVEKLIKQ